MGDNREFMRSRYFVFMFNVGLNSHTACRREPATFNNKGTGIGQDGLEYIIASCHYRDILIIILVTYMLFVCI